MVPVSTVKPNNNTGVLITILICLFLSVILAVYYFFLVNKKVDSDPVLMVDNNSQVSFEKEGAPSIHSINGVFGPQNVIHSEEQSVSIDFLVKKEVI